MATKAGKRKNEVTLSVDIEEEAEELVEDASATASNVTSQIYLKPMRPSENMEKDVILRRIRHRKRMNKVKGAVEALFSSSFTTPATTNLKKDRVDPPKRWVDDAFAAP